MSKGNTKNNNIGCLGILGIVLLFTFAITIYSYFWIPAIAILVYCLKSKKFEQYKKRNTVICSIVIATSLATFVWLNIPENNTEKEAKKEEYKLQDEHTSTLEKMTDTPLPDGMSKLDEYKFKAKYIGAKSNQDLTDYINNDASDEEKAAYTITKINAEAHSKTADVYIASQTELQEINNAKNLSEKLDAGHAWIAVQKYGEQQFLYGFDLHSVAGQIAEDAVDENTWFLKATCDVTDISGEKVEMTCEAHVTGTNDNPNVVDFIVY